MLRKLLVMGYGSTLLIGAYLRSSNSLVYDFESNRPWIWMLLLLFMSLMLWSYGNVRPSRVGKLSRLFQCTLIGLALVSLYGGLQLLPSLGSVINFLSYDSLEIFAEIYDSNRGNGNTAGVNIPVVLFNATRDLFTLVFFLGLANIGISRSLHILSILLLVVALLNSVLHGFRNVLSFVVLDTFFFYFYLSKIISLKLKKRLFRKLRIFLTVVLTMIVALTIGRFSTSYTSLDNPLNSTIHYVGQAPNFIETAVGRNGGNGGGLRTFALINNVLLDGPSGFEERRIVNNRLKFDDRYFFYWFGDIIIDNGVMGYLLIFLILGFIAGRRRFGLNGIHHLFMEYIVWILLAHGLFLNPFGDIVGNISFLLLCTLGLFSREKVYDKIG